MYICPGVRINLVTRLLSQYVYFLILYIFFIFQMKGSIKVLKDQEVRLVEGLLNALR